VRSGFGTSRVRKEDLPTPFSGEAIDYRRQHDSIEEKNGRERAEKKKENRGIKFNPVGAWWGGEKKKKGRGLEGAAEG